MAAKSSVVTAQFSPGDRAGLPSVSIQNLLNSRMRDERGGASFPRSEPNISYSM
jgi:hypothetical protein